MNELEKASLNNSNSSTVDRFTVKTFSDSSLTSGQTKNTFSSGSGSNSSRTCLIVNYLPQSVKEEKFRQLFSSIGRLRYCRLMFDRATGYSYGYGFVDFYRAEDAAKAIETLNQMKMEHKTIKVSYARPKCDETRGTNLYIRNLPENFDEKQLIELFSNYGEIIQARIIRDQSTEATRGIAFVIMATRSEAQRAVDSLNGQTIDQKRNLLVKFADDDKRRRQLMSRYLPKLDPNPNDILTSQMARLNLLNNNNAPIQFSTNNATENQQQTQDLNLLMNTLLMMPILSNICNSTIPSLPIAYPTNKNIQAESANDGSSNSPLNPSDSLSNEFSTVSSSMIDPATGGFIVFVYGIGPETSQDELLNIFRGFGQILRTDVIKNKRTALGKGYGFVVFRYINDALASIKALHNISYKGRFLQVRFRV